MTWICPFSFIILLAKTLAATFVHIINAQITGATKIAVVHTHIHANHIVYSQQKKIVIIIIKCAKEKEFFQSARATQAHTHTYRKRWFWFEQVLKLTNDTKKKILIWNFLKKYIRLIQTRCSYCICRKIFNVQLEYMNTYTFKECTDTKTE